MTERLQVMEQIWDTVCREPGGIESPDWHQEVLADREARAQRNEASFLTLEQLRARIRDTGP